MIHVTTESRSAAGSRLRMRGAAFLGLVCLAMSGGGPLVRAADYRQARELYYRGDLDACIEMTQTEVESGIWNDFWARLLIRCLLDQGRYDEARRVYESVESKFASSIPLRVLGAEAYRFCGQSDRADRLLGAIPELVRNAPWRYSDRENLLAIGKYLLSEGVDAREVLTGFYDRVLRIDDQFVDAHIAIAELAIDKADYQEAVRSLEEAVRIRSQDPYIHYLLAVAWAPSDPEKANAYLNEAFRRNPFHVDSLLMEAGELIDGEEYRRAEEVLGQVFQVNPHHPKAWALKAAIAHLQGHYEEEGKFRSRALKHWDLNPEVDYLIGWMLSKHYRFEEGVRYQRRALRMDPDYLPARFQLALDLLRTGREDEGWSIVDQVASTDKYNVVAYNLSTLRRRLEQFVTLEAPGFVVRMDAKEAQIYGVRVLELLEEARNTLSQRYAFEPRGPVVVEIFPQQSDFAIRTFGLPGGAGYLGVCFGALITANSPASQGESPANWESVLWHEFCHVITLQKTHNRMPRWLSEGISVYEEMQRNATWGQPISPDFKKMLLSEDFVPLSQLSGAFLNPKSPAHIEFAYFESALAVEYLIDMHGLPRLLKLLEDLGMGMTIQDAFQQRYGAMAILDQEFAQFVRQRAETFLPQTDFDRSELPDSTSLKDLQTWVAQHPNNYHGWRRVCEMLIADQRWEEALVAARRLLELFPADASAGGGLEMMAAIARQLDDVDLERDALERLVGASADNVSALLRLIDLDREAQRFEAMEKHARGLLAVQPLIPAGHEAMVEAARARGDLTAAIPSLRALMVMDPIDPAGVQYRLAQALLAAGNLDAARREVLLVLEATPRYRDAQKLLVEIGRRVERAGEQPPSPDNMGPKDAESAKASAP